MWPDGGGFVQRGHASGRQHNAARCQPPPRPDNALCPHRGDPAAPPSRPRSWRIWRNVVFAAASSLPNQKSGAERPELRPTLERRQIIRGDRPTGAVALALTGREMARPSRSAAKVFQLARRAIVAVVL